MRKGKYYFGEKEVCAYLGFMLAKEIDRAEEALKREGVDKAKNIVTGLVVPRLRKLLENLCLSPGNEWRAKWLITKIEEQLPYKEFPEEMEEFIKFLRDEAEEMLLSSAVQEILL